MKFRILNVNADPALRQAITSMLESEGYSAIEAQDGAAAFSEIRKETPALVLAQARMPGMDGCDICKQIRQ